MHLEIQDQNYQVNGHMSVFLGSTDDETNENRRVSCRKSKIEKSLFGRNQSVNKRILRVVSEPLQICGDWEERE